MEKQTLNLDLVLSSIYDFHFVHTLFYVHVSSFSNQII